MTLQGQIKPISLQGSINVVPNEGGAGGPLQSKTVYPSHEEQIITPDDDFYGLSLVTVKAVPRVPACFAETSHQLPNVVETRVNIGVKVSVTAGKYYTHALYNGVRLPRIPENVLASYPYAWIRKHTTNGVYQLMLSASGFYYETGGVMVDKGSVVNPKYTFPIGDTTNTAWTNANNTTYYRWTVDDARPVMWSNHDIPNGSADATDIYFNGSEPILTD